jgi:glucokinase
MAPEKILACDVGGTHLRVSVTDTHGVVHEKRVVPTPLDDPAALTRAMESLRDEYPQHIAGAVVGVPGNVDYMNGRVIYLPNLPEWGTHIMEKRLARDLGMEVLLANDADLAALGEHRFGAGVGSSDMAYVTVSTGVGAGVVIGGRLLHGNVSLAELGHTVIDRQAYGTVESLGSGTALGRIAGEDGAAVTEKARAGDEQALGYIAEIADSLAVGVLNLAHIFSPQVIVVGGGLSQAGDLILGPIRIMLAERGKNFPASRAKVVLASGGDDVGLKGAAAYWSDRRLDNSKNSL